jgi:hypothetical protein
MQLSGDESEGFGTEMGVEVNAALYMFLLLFLVNLAPYPIILS